MLFLVLSFSSLEQDHSIQIKLVWLKMFAAFCDDFSLDKQSSIATFSAVERQCYQYFLLFLCFIDPKRK